MRIGVAITKKTLFRNADQEFSNTYYLELVTAVTAPSEAIVDEIVTKEKAMHSGAVTFVRAKVWSAGGTKAENQMIFEKNLSGTGAAVTIASMDRERAVLVRFRAGFDSRGLPVFLRKWYHTCGNFAGGDLTQTAVQGNTGEILQATRTTIQNLANDLRVISGLWSLCSSKGRNITNGATAEAHRFLEHHQLGDAWR